jgi:hypothetical protein
MYGARRVDRYVIVGSITDANAKAPRRIRDQWAASINRHRPVDARHRAVSSLHGTK